MGRNAIKAIIKSHVTRVYYIKNRCTNFKSTPKFMLLIISRGDIVLPKKTKIKITPPPNEKTFGGTFLIFNFS